MVIQNEFIDQSGDLLESFEPPIAEAANEGETSTAVIERAHAGLTLSPSDTSQSLSDQYWDGLSQITDVDTNIISVQQTIFQHAQDDPPELFTEAALDLLSPSQYLISPGAQNTNCITATEPTCQLTTNMCDEVLIIDQPSTMSHTVSAYITIRQPSDRSKMPRFDPVDETSVSNRVVTAAPGDQIPCPGRQSKRQWRSADSKCS